MPMTFLHLSFILIFLHVQVLIFLDLNRMLSFSPSHQLQLFIGRDSVQNNSCLESRMSLFLRVVEAIDLIRLLQRRCSRLLLWSC